MSLGIFMLVLAYVLSQFYRAFLAVLSPVLEAELGAGPEDLSFASGLWFLTFAIMQLPVGWALDTIGPRKTAATLFVFGGAGGALVFAVATTPMHINIAMVLIGIGCSPVLMASYFIFARTYPAAVFATMAAFVIGVGSLGNIAGSAPMAWAVEAFGWRETMFGLALVSAAIAVAVWFSVNDPERVETDAKGSVFDLLKIPALWFIFPMMFVNYAPAAGLRGLWIGPYMSDIFGADAARIGTATLVMALAMVVGNFVYGPLDRIFGTRKWVIFVGNAIGVTACFALWSFDNSSIWTATFWFAAVGFCGGSFPVMIAHSKTFFPAHLTGRGVTLLNLFGIGGAGLMQVITGRIYAAKLSESGSPAVAYDTLFLFFGLLVCAGLAIYAFSQDRMD